MWTSSCLELGNHRLHVEERAWRIIDRARLVNIIYSEEEIKEEILKLIQNFVDFENLGTDYETSLPKLKIKGFLSKTQFPIYMIIIEDRKYKSRMIKTVWTDYEEILRE